MLLRVGFLPQVAFNVHKFDNNWCPMMIFLIIQFNSFFGREKSGTIWYIGPHTFLRQMLHQQLIGRFFYVYYAQFTLIIIPVQQPGR